METDITEYDTVVDAACVAVCYCCCTALALDHSTSHVHLPLSAIFRASGVISGIGVVSIARFAGGAGGSSGAGTGQASFDLTYLVAA